MSFNLFENFLNICYYTPNPSDTALIPFYSTEHHKKYEKKVFFQNPFQKLYSYFCASEWLIKIKS